MVAILPAILAWAVLAASIIWPIARTVWSLSIDVPNRASGGFFASLPSASLCAKSMAWACTIAACGVVLAWGPAWWARRRGWHVAPWLCVPLLLPSYLAYAGLGIARAPGTPLGDRLERLVGQGWPDAPVLASRVQAVVGLALWVWPIAALVLLAGLFNIERSVLEQLRLDTRSAWARHAQLALIARHALAASLAATTLVMLGSAVPLHLADAPTLAVKTWLDMTLRPGDPGVWWGSAPSLLAAACGAWALASRRWGTAGATNDDVGDTGTPAPSLAQDGPLGRLTLFALIAASTLLPAALLASVLRDARPLTQFWVLSGPALIGSLCVAGATGACVTLVALWAWFAGSESRRGCAPPASVRIALGLTLFAGLVPGVLVGKAIGEGYAFAPSLADTQALVVLGHVARFGFVGVLAGLWLARAEPAGLRDVRVIDGSAGLRGWAGAALALRWPALAGLAMCVGALSLHEIECAIFLQPPGLGSLAQTLLGYLHYSKLTELSAAAVWLVGGGTALAGVSAWLLARALRHQH